MLGKQSEISVLVVGTPRRAAFADTMLQDIDRGFRLSGVDSQLVLLESDDLQPYFDKRDELINAGREVCQFDLNASFSISALECEPRPRRFTLLIDHPYFHLERLLSCDREVEIGVVDRTHMTALQDYGLDFPVRFVPHGGPDPDLLPLPMEQRDIDVLYCANLSPLIFEPVFMRELEGLPVPLKTLVTETINLVMGGRSDIHASLREACQATQRQPLSALPAEHLKIALNLIEGLTVSLQRRDVVEALCRIPGGNVHIVGNIPDILSREALNPLPNVEIHGLLPFPQVIDMMRRAKLLVNSNFSLSGGAHERIWQGMATGCVLLTNDSSFMRDSFTHGRDILFLPENPTHLPGLVEEWLETPECLAEMAAQTSIAYRENHLWKHRMASLFSPN